EVLEFLLGRVRGHPALLGSRLLIFLQQVEDLLGIAPEQIGHQGDEENPDPPADGNTTRRQGPPILNVLALPPSLPLHVLPPRESTHDLVIRACFESSAFCPRVPR